MSNQFLFTKNFQELKGMFAKNKRIKEKLVTISDVSVKII